MTYDGLGRLEGIGTSTQVIWGPSSEKLGYLVSGTLVSSLKLPGGGEASYNGSSLTAVRHKDWLGSSRLATTWSHGILSKTAYAPFGETYNTSGRADGDFTGMTEDASTDLADFPARKYDANAGRWTVPDPGAWSVVDPTNPQSFNRYAYVLNNPLSNIDPNGLTSCFYGGAGDTPSNDQDPSDYEDTGTDADCTANGGTVLSVDVVDNVSADGTDNGEIDADGGGESTLVEVFGGGRPAGVVNPFTCGAEAASKVSLANGINNIPGAKYLNSLTGGTTGFITDSVGGNVFSGATDLITSLGSGESGGHSVFYNLGQGVVAGPTQGFGALANGTKFGAAIEDTPLTADWWMPLCLQFL